MKKVWIFDIDGTLADNDHRMHHLDNGKKEWDAFFSKQHLDVPYQPVLDVLHALYDVGYKIIIVTARDERFRADTIDWLSKHIDRPIPISDVYMRPLGHRGDDNLLKVQIIKEWLEKNPDYKVSGIFDDRHRIIDAFRNEGWYTFECNQARKEF